MKSDHKQCTLMPMDCTNQPTTHLENPVQERNGIPKEQWTEFQDQGQATTGSRMRTAQRLLLDLSVPDGHF